MKFYECKKCGNVIAYFEDKGIIPVCCGSTMDELVPLTKDNGEEKHVPVIEKDDCELKVKVGETLHPMEDNHYIKWIVLETDNGKYIKTLKPGNDPIATFKISKNENPIAVYEFCNIHSLWENKL